MTGQTKNDPRDLGDRSKFNYSKKSIKTVLERLFVSGEANVARVTTLAG